MLRLIIQLLPGTGPQVQLLQLPEDIAMRCRMASLEDGVRHACSVQSMRATCNMQEDIVNALALTGQVLMGQAVMVKSSEVSNLAGLHLITS